MLFLRFDWRFYVCCFGIPDSPPYMLFRFIYFLAFFLPLALRLGALAGAALELLDFL